MSLSRPVPPNPSCHSMLDSARGRMQAATKPPSGHLRPALFRAARSREDLVELLRHHRAAIGRRNPLHPAPRLAAVEPRGELQLWETPEEAAPRIAKVEDIDERLFGRGQLDPLVRDLRVSIEELGCQS